MVDWFASKMNEYLLAVIFVALATAVSSVIEPFTGYLSIALLYILLVVAVGLRLRQIGRASCRERVYVLV